MELWSSYSYNYSIHDKSGLICREISKKQPKTLPIFGGSNAIILNAKLFESLTFLRC